MKTRKFVAAMLALVMMLGLCSCASADEAIKIGVIGPMTGGAAVYGNAVAYGAQIAVDEINALGGIQLALDVQDDEHDPEKGVNAFNAVLDNGAQMILGTVTTAPCIAVAAEAYEERVFMLTPSASSTKVIEGRDNVYQVCFTDPAQGAASAQYIFDNKLGTKVGIIYNNGSDYSVGIYQTFIEKAKELGLEVVAEPTFSSEDNADFSVQVAACKDNGADVVFLPIYYTPASLILAQAKSVEYAPTFFGVDGMDGILTLEGFDKTLAEGVMLLTPFSADAEDEQTKNFVAKYQEKHGEVPNQFAADAYDGVYALYQAIQNAGITADTEYADACELLIAEMQKIEVAGLTGTMTWAATGEVTKTPTAVVIENGVYVGVK
ncbi:MAG: ABC transporter substrate-binding protein [Clostridia bacterium]|nr:ABC transporter substrate-binding protein [Clostridia bacterium]